MKPIKGKVYPSLEVLKEEHPQGFAVIEHPNLFGDPPRCWWHRKHPPVRRRVASLWHRKVPAYIESLDDLVTLPKG
jgi:hypothetical protein